MGSSIMPNHDSIRLFLLFNSLQKDIGKWVKREKSMRTPKKSVDELRSLVEVGVSVLKEKEQDI